MEKRVFFKRILKAIVVWFNKSLCKLCKFTILAIRWIKYRYRLVFKYKYYNRKHWENY
jgi:hypothetical protein